MLKIKTQQINLLESLTNAAAVSGDEAEVRKIIRAEIADLVDELKTDALGNLLAVKYGKRKKAPSVMLAAHMDEVGFMLVDGSDGLFEFETIGGIDSRQLIGKVVQIGREHIPGVIGAAPVHLIGPDERKRKLSISALRIDVGPGSSNVKAGDRATFATKFERIGASIRAKALDDRLGVAILIELLKHAPDNVTLQAAFTVQEEVGLRGAKVAAYNLNPDMAFVVDSTPAYDLPMHDGSENIRPNTRLGAGPAIYTMDRRTLSDPRLIALLRQAGDENKIPYQFRQPGGGGTDAGSIHLTRAGIPTVSVSVPGRYAHTAMGLCRIKDWEHTLNLLHAALGSVTSKLLEKAR